MKCAKIIMLYSMYCKIKMLIKLVLLLSHITDHIGLLTETYIVLQFQVYNNPFFRYCSIFNFPRLFYHYPLPL